MMDRFLGGKSQKEYIQETSKPLKKHSQKKKLSDDQRAWPPRQSFFPTPNQNDGPGIPFKNLEKNGFGCPRLRSLPRSKSHRKTKKSSFNKILGAICGDNFSKERKQRSASGRSNESVSSSSSSPSQQTEHRSYYRLQKRRKENEENFQKRFDEDEDYFRNEKRQLRGETDNLKRYFKDRKDEACHRRGDNFCGNGENQPRNISRRLTFSPSESEEGSSPSVVQKDHLSPGLRDRVSHIFAQNEELGGSSRIAMKADNKETSKNPVLLKASKPLMSEQDLLTEYTDLAAAITDELAIEQQKRFSEKSYLETITQNLLKVFLDRGNENKDVPENKSDGTQVTGTGFFDGLDFVTPIASGMEAVSGIEPSLELGSRKTREREIESLAQPKRTAAFDVPVIAKDGPSSSPEENVPVDVFSQFKHNCPEKQVPQRTGELSPYISLWFQRNPNLCLPSTGDDYLAGRSNDDLIFTKDVPPSNSNEEVEHQRKHSVDAGNYGYRANLKSCGESRPRPPKRPYRECLFSPQPILPQNEDLLKLFSHRRTDYSKSFASRHHTLRGTEKNFRRQTCTATSTTPIDFGLSDSPLPILEIQSGEEFRTSFLDEVGNLKMRDEDIFSVDQGCNRQRERTRDGSLHINPFGSIDPSRCREKTEFVQFSQKESFLNSVSLTSNKKDDVLKKEDWALSPKFYKRRMF